MKRLRRLFTKQYAVPLIAALLLLTILVSSQIFEMLGFGAGERLTVILSALSLCFGAATLIELRRWRT